MAKKTKTKTKAKKPDSGKLKEQPKAAEAPEIGRAHV